MEGLLSFFIVCQWQIEHYHLFYFFIFPMNTYPLSWIVCHLTNFLSRELFVVCENLKLLPFFPSTSLIIPCPELYVKFNMWGVHVTNNMLEGLLSLYMKLYDDYAHNCFLRRSTTLLNLSLVLFLDISYT